MTSIVQRQHMDYSNVAETLFLGGTTLTAQSATGFTTQSGAFTLRFTGTDLTYDADGTLTGGTVAGYVVRELTDAGTVTDITVTGTGGAPNLISTADLAHAFALYDGGDPEAAFNAVLSDWESPLYQTMFSTDDLHGYSGDDHLDAPRGGIQISGRGGDDVITGGFGKHATGSTIYGGGGDDTVHAAQGDTVYGGSGGDHILTGKAHDLSTGLLYGGSGDDIIQTRRIDARVYGGVDDDTLAGARVYGGQGDDRVFGYATADNLFGGSGKDVLKGRGGDDTLYGGGGDDDLRGGAGSNVLGGGAGADTFHFSHVAGATDVITDFNAAEDTISLKQFHFADLAAVQAVLSETGAGVSFDFGNGQTLLVQDVTLADLLPDLTL